MFTQSAFEMSVKKNIYMRMKDDVDQHKEQRRNLAFYFIGHKHRTGGCVTLSLRCFP